MAWIGELPQIGSWPLLYVFKCEPCRAIISVKVG
jgi:hypothetical protein